MMDEIAAKDYLLNDLNVSHETFSSLQIYHDLLIKWNPKINLVSPTTLSEIWFRHIVDSAQICSPLESISGSWVDIGSGAGFPGLVAAIVHKGISQDLKFTFIESDQRKCSFLRTVSRETNTPIEIDNVRIENAVQRRADVISCRALAPLSVLLSICENLSKPSTKCLFLKGEKYVAEIEQAQENWAFTYNAKQSITDSKAAILTIQEFGRAQ